MMDQDSDGEVSREEMAMFMIKEWLLADNMGHPLEWYIKYLKFIEKASGLKLVAWWQPIVRVAFKYSP